MVKKLINIVYLKYFFDAVLHNSISISAKENFVSQSAISQGINKLEKSLNINLITHQMGSFKLTLEGQIIFEKSKIIFDNLDFLQQKLEDPIDNNRGFFEFVCEPAFAQTVLPPILKQFNLQYPLLKYKIQLAPHEEILPIIKKGVVDFGFIMDNNHYDSEIEMYLDKYKLYKCKNEKVIPKVFFINSNSSINFYNLISFVQNNDNFKDFDLVRINCYQVMKSFISQNLGIGFLPHFIYHYNKIDLEEIYLKGNNKIFDYRIKAIISFRIKLYSCAEKFLNFTKSYLKGII